MKNYRNKIYKYYSTNSGRNLAPTLIEGLSIREPFYKNIIAKYFPPNKDSKIIEIGCGYGAFQYIIKQAGYTNSIGIDASDEQVSEAKRLGIKNVHLADIGDYLRETKDNSFDVLIAIDVIEHFTKEELSDLIDMFYRVLKKDGIIITHQPNAEGIFSNSIIYGDFTHELAFTRSSISQIFYSSGFKEISFLEDKPLKHSIKSIFRLYLWEYLIKPIYRFALTVESGGVEKEYIFSKNFLSIIKK